MSSSSSLPLKGHADFRATSIEEIAETVHARLFAQLVKVDNDASVNAQGNRLGLSSTTLWSCSYGVPLRLRFSETSDFRVQFHRQGLGATRAGKGVVGISPRQSCISLGEAEVDFLRDFVQVVWRVPAVVLERKLTAFAGRALPRRLEFDPVLDLSTPASVALLQILESLLQLIEAESGSSTRLLQAELENALVVSLLCAGRHNFRDWLDQDCPAPAPWQVKRAESFIEAHWDQPITLEDIVTATGMSARSVFRGFRQHRGCSPLQFARQLRLQQAKRLLQDPDTNLNVTEVAMACGYTDLSRFTKDFTRAFGMPPSKFRNSGSTL